MEEKRRVIVDFDLHTMAWSLTMFTILIWKKKYNEDEFTMNFSRFVHVSYYLLLDDVSPSFSFPLRNSFLRGNLYNVSVYFAISQGSRKLIYRIIFIVVFGILTRILCILRVFNCKKKNGWQVLTILINKFSR